MTIKFLDIVCLKTVGFFSNWTSKVAVYKHTSFKSDVYRFLQKKVSSMNAFSSAVQAISKLSFVGPIDQSFVIADVKNQKISLITPKDIRDLVMTKLSWSPGIRRICVAYSPCMRCSTRNVRVAIKSGIRSIRVATSCFYLWYYSATRPWILKPR